MFDHNCFVNILCGTTLCHQWLLIILFCYEQCLLSVWAGVRCVSEHVYYCISCMAQVTGGIITQRVRLFLYIVLLNKASQLQLYLINYVHSHQCIKLTAMHGAVCVIFAYYLLFKNSTPHKEQCMRWTPSHLIEFPTYSCRYTLLVGYVQLKSDNASEIGLSTAPTTPNCWYGQLGTLECFHGSRLCRLGVHMESARVRHLFFLQVTVNHTTSVCNRTTARRHNVYMLSISIIITPS